MGPIYVVNPVEATEELTRSMFCVDKSTDIVETERW